MYGGGNIPKKYVLETISEELQEKLLKDYEFWSNLRDDYYVNIFDGISEADYLHMVRYANFGKLLQKTGISQRVKKNIVVLQKVLGKGWAEQAAINIGTKLGECQKRSEFPEWKHLKKLYK